MSQEGAAGAASDCENVSDTAACDDFPGLARAAGAAGAASRGPSTSMGPPPTVLSALAQLALGSDSIVNRGPSTQCFARSGRDGRRLKCEACRASSRSRRLLPPSQALLAPQSPARSRGRGRRGLAGRRALLRSKRRRRTQPSLNRARCHKRRRLVTEPDPDAPGQFEDGASDGATSFPRASR